MLNLQDFSLVNTKVKKIKKDNNLSTSADAFYFLAISSIVDLQDDEISDSITDTSFLKAQSKGGGHDRGIDAIYIDYEKKNPTVHIFNCKYTEKYEKARDNNFSSLEVDKIGDYFRALLNKDEATIENSNLAKKCTPCQDRFKNHHDTLFSPCTIALPKVAPYTSHGY